MDLWSIPDYRKEEEKGNYGEIKYDEEQGYKYISNKGIDYDLIEGKPLDGNEMYNIIFVVFYDSDNIGVNKWYYLGFIYESDFRNKEKNILHSLFNLAMWFEYRHQRIARYYKRKNMINKFKGTVDVLLDANIEQLGDGEVNDIRNQMSFLDELQRPY